MMSFKLELVHLVVNKVNMTLVGVSGLFLLLSIMVGYKLLHFVFRKQGDVMDDSTRERG